MRCQPAHSSAQASPGENRTAHAARPCALALRSRWLSPAAQSSPRPRSRDPRLAPYQRVSARSRGFGWASNITCCYPHTSVCVRRGARRRAARKPPRPCNSRYVKCPPRQCIGAKRLCMPARRAARTRPASMRQKPARHPWLACLRRSVASCARWKCAHSSRLLPRAWLSQASRWSLRSDVLAPVSVIASRAARRTRLRLRSRRSAARGRRRTLLGKKPPSNAQRHRRKGKSKSHGLALMSIDAN